jgi:hypothetical protein
MQTQNKPDLCFLDFNVNEIGNSFTEDNPDADDVGSKIIEGLLAREELRKRINERELREKYANKVFMFISFWSGGLFLILLLEGFKEFTRFVLDKSVLITLLATSFIEVLGLFYFVMDYLFNKKEKLVVNKQQN